MSTFDPSVLRRTFGDAAYAYDQGRPSYPADLVAAVVARLPRQPARFLEVGCRSGQATRLFVPYASEITALDMSAELLALAHANVQAPNVRYVCTTFEAAQLPPRTYDALISAQAFHWIDPAVGVAKAQDLVAPDGLIALFWNFAHLEAQPYLRQCREHMLTLAPPTPPGRRRRRGALRRSARSGSGRSPVSHTSGSATPARFTGVCSGHRPKPWRG